jgi:YegS/Rv2252/BmrU family lipid kinase
MRTSPIEICLTKLALFYLSCDPIRVNPLYIREIRVAKIRVAKMNEPTSPFWHIIVNPAAAGGSVQKRWPQIEQLLQDMGFSYSVYFTEYRGHATRLAEDALLKGGRYILGIGGDGTNHEIANGILGQSFVPSSEVNYALLPVGTGNDWARQYGISAAPQERLEKLKAQQTVFQDAGMVEYVAEGETRKRYFINVAGMAYDGFIGKKLTERPAQNRLHYLLMVAQYLMEYRLTAAKISFDGQTVEDKFYTINIGLCRYSGGGMQLAPHAVPDDGLFALTYAGQLSKAEVLLQTPRFYNGTLLEHPKVGSAQVRSLLVEQTGDSPTLLEADGEFLGETPAVFTLLEKALKVVL